jgi:hypothetical protein
MKRRIWLEVDGVQLCSLKLQQQKEREGRCAWGSLKVGSNGFNLNNILFRMWEDGCLTQNWAMAGAKLLDVPIKHHKKKTPKMLLENILAKTIFEIYMKKRGKDLRAVINGEKEMVEFPFSKQWNSPLRIPVDFVRLQNFACACEEKKVWADVQVGHHLIFWGVPIFDLNRASDRFQYNKEIGGAIQDDRVISVINGLLSDRVLQERAFDLRSDRYREDEKLEFSDAITDCQMNRVLPPPIKFY